MTEFLSKALDGRVCARTRPEMSGCTLLAKRAICTSGLYQAEHAASRAGTYAARIYLLPAFSLQFSYCLLDDLLVVRGYKSLVHKLLVARHIVASNGKRLDELCVHRVGVDIDSGLELLEQ
jgi:hypothetical protein